MIFFATKLHTPSPQYARITEMDTLMKLETIAIMELFLNLRSLLANDAGIIYNARIIMVTLSIRITSFNIGRWKYSLIYGANINNNIKRDADITRFDTNIVEQSIF